MPDQPTWLERVPAIEAALRAETAPALLNRGAIEALFGVRRRRAIILLHRCHAHRRERELVATRESVLALLAETRADGTFEELTEQRERVAEFLAEARYSRALPSIRIPAPARLPEVTLAGLPAGIRLRKGELSVIFVSAEELIGKLFALAQALANDYESLEGALAQVASDEEGAAPGTSL